MGFPAQPRCRSFALEEKLRAKLDEPRRIGAKNMAECIAADIAVDSLRTEELRVIENVKALEPELQGFRFGEAQFFRTAISKLFMPGP